MIQGDYGNNRPLNVPALEVIERLAGPAPEDVRNTLLDAPFSDALSGLRIHAARFRDSDGWGEIKQPKHEIGDYARDHGITVPKFYESADAAMRAVSLGKKVIMRSEHPQEYDGFSGLLQSYHIDEDEIARQKMSEEVAVHDSGYVAKLLGSGASIEEIEQVVAQEVVNERRMRRYLRFSRQDEDRFRENLTYSFWEYIPGQNITVVADDAVAGRFHFTACGGQDWGGGIFNSNGNEVGGLEHDPNMPTPLDGPTRASIFETYEVIRSLPKFSSRNCPIMEFQLSNDGTLYFLQYHKSRPFREATEMINPSDYPSGDGWQKAQAVRGALGSFVTLRTALWYPENGDKPGDKSVYIPDELEAASMDLHYDYGLTEFASPGRAAYLGIIGYPRTYLEMADGRHENRSRWFKPAGALTITKEQHSTLLPDEARSRVSTAVHIAHKMAGFMIDYASDGRAGYVRLNPKSDGPVFWPANFS